MAWKGRRAAWRRRLGITALLVAVAIGHTWSYFRGINATSQVRDWIVIQAAAETTRRTVLVHGQLPQWDPWRGGGTPHLANPTVDVLSPWALVQLAVGVSLSIRIHATLHLLAAMLGMWVWARRRGLSPPAALGAALVFGLQGPFAAWIAWGYGYLLPCAYLPWLMMFYEASRRRLASTVGVAACIALMLLEGGLGPALLAVLLLVLRTVVDALSAPRHAARFLLSLTVSLGCAAGLAAPKLVPTLLLLRARPLPLPKPDTLTLGHLATLFLGRDTGHWIPGFTFERYEYFGYLGPAVLLAALWGAWTVRDAPFRRPLIAAGLLSLLLIGDHGAWMPYSWLVEVPLLRWLVAVPARLAVGVGLVLSLVFGYALERIARGALLSWSGRPLRITALVIAIVTAADLACVAQGQWRRQPFAGDPIRSAAAPFSLQRGSRATQYQLLLRNQGTLQCHQLVPISASKRLRLGVQPQAWAADPIAGKISIARFSPNRLWIHVDLRRPTTVIVNQNTAAGWSAEGELATRVASVDGLLAVEVEAGAGQIELRYQTPGLLAGAVLQVATMGGLIAAWLVARLRRRADAEEDA